MNKHYCYLIGGGPFIKVGYTADVEQRITVLQTGNPYPLELIQTFVFDTELAARALERQLHRALDQARVEGEWFKRKHAMKLLRKESAELLPTNGQAA